MTKEQEDKIIKQAQDILERRLGVENDVKIDLKNLLYYGAYYMGALACSKKFLETIFSNSSKPKGDDWVYLQAEWALCSSSKENMRLWLEGYDIGLRNHKRDNKGKLVSCEAYFIGTKK